MATALVLIALGVMTQVIVLATSRNTLPCFTRRCNSCGNYLPPMERPPVTYDCPECERLMAMGVDLSSPLTKQ